MKLKKFEILTDSLLEDYKILVDKQVKSSFASLKDSEMSARSFSFYTSVSVVFSSKIEGENIELDSFIKHKKLGVKFLPDYTRKIDDLYNAYQFAEQNIINESNVNAAHQLITENILQASQRGTIRTGNMFVMTPDGKIEYVACGPATVQGGNGKVIPRYWSIIRGRIRLF